MFSTVEALTPLQHLPFDISRCNNTACPLAHECLRFLDWPKDGSHRLPMNAFEYDRQAMNCDHFIQHQTGPDGQQQTP